MNVTSSPRRGRERPISAAEDLLWSCLRDGRLDGWAFQRRALPDGTAQFTCADALLTVQLNAEPGPLTFTSLEVLLQIDVVLETILLAIRTATVRRPLDVRRYPAALAEPGSTVSPIRC